MPGKVGKTIQGTIINNNSNKNPEEIRILPKLHFREIQNGLSCLISVRKRTGGLSCDMSRTGYPSQKVATMWCFVIRIRFSKLELNCHMNNS